MDKGLTFFQTAQLLMLDDNTVRAAYQLYIEEGLVGFMQFKYEGGLSYLTQEDQALLSEHLQDKLYVHSKDIKAYVKATYGVEYTEEGIRGLIKKLGFVYKKTKHLPGKADVQKQKEFEKQYRKLKQNKALEDEIYFMDGVHPLHNSITANGWIRKGQERGVQANTGRERLNINGACNAATGKVVLHQCEAINAQATIELFKKMQVRQPNGKLFIIADNARYYRSLAVQDYIKSNKRVNLIFLPSYSPNLNLIEQLWKFYKKEFLYNHYYPDFDEFKNASINFFRKLKNRKDELIVLLRDNFYFPNSRFPKPKLV